MLVNLSTWPEFEEQLKKSKAVLIPIGSTEQHGPNGLLGTDVICPELISRAAAEQVPMLIGPTFNVGQAQHHMDFPGTMTVRPSTMIAAMFDWAQSLARHGFDRIYWLNGHGGNVATITAAFSEIYHNLTFSAATPTPRRLRCALRNWWELDGVPEICDELFPTGMGMHATPAEVSVTCYGYPELQKRIKMSPTIAPVGEIHDARDYRHRFPDGRIGSDPEQASAEAGRKIVTAAADALAKDYRVFESS